MAADVTPTEAALGLLRLAGLADNVAGQNVTVTVQEDAVRVAVPASG